MQYLALFVLINLGLIYSAIACNEDKSAQLERVIKEWVAVDADITSSTRDLYWKACRELLDEGADSNSLGLLPIHLAALTGHTKYIAKLLRNNSFLEHCEINLSLNYALFSCHSETAALLLAWGATLNEHDKITSLDTLSARSVLPPTYSLYEEWMVYDPLNNTAHNLTNYAVENGHLLLLSFMLEAPITKEQAARIVLRSILHAPVLSLLSRGMIANIPKDVIFYIGSLLFALERQRLGKQRQCIDC